MQGERPIGEISEAKVQKCKEVFNQNAREWGGRARAHYMNFSPAVIPGCANISYVNQNNGSIVWEDDKWQLRTGSGSITICIPIS